MPELRKDPVIGRWVIIATERAKRPTDFAVEDEQGLEDLSKCPFCEGNEGMTPPEIIAYRDGSKPNTPGWQLRVIPNKFPALMIEGALGRVGEGMFDKMSGVGAHEVIVETPKHLKNITSLSKTEMNNVIWAYRDRTIDLRKDERLRYVAIFKNKGQAAGASLEHTHSQLIALPIVPKRVTEEMKGAQEYYSFKERCVFCDIVQQELKDGVRVVAENIDFIAISPYAPKAPFETWIIPKVHSSNFDSIKKGEVENLANLLQELLLRLEKALHDPPYNYIIHTSPFSDHTPLYHWHIEVMPKLTKHAGFEWGSGFYINPTPPEMAAEYLRNVELD